MSVAPRYPIYIPSKARAASLFTARMFRKDKVPFRVVVEPSQEKAYVAAGWGENLLLLPEDGKGLTYSRNFITDHARATGIERHWQFDDDVRTMIRLHKGTRIPCASNIALSVGEDFVERYTNVAIASFNSEFFCPVNNGVSVQQWPPFYRNARCYTNMLFWNKLNNRWRGLYNEDTDMTLQVLSEGFCTLLFNAFMMRTFATMTSKGGQTTKYGALDGRLKMSRELERRWPGVVTTYRRFGRAQHKVAMFWRQFDTALIEREGWTPPADPTYGLELVEVRKVKSTELKALAAALRE